MSESFHPLKNANKLFANANQLLNEIREIFYVIKNSGSIAKQIYPDLIQELDKKFQTIELFERKKAHFEDSKREVEEKIGISKLHLSSVYSQKLTTLQAQLKTYDNEKYSAVKDISELKKDFESTSDQKIRFFHKKKDKAAINRQLNIIKNYIDPLFNKANAISPLLDEVGGEFSRKRDKHKPDMDREDSECFIF